MTTLAASLPKNLQARTTTGILNIVRIVGTGAFALLAVLLGILMLVQLGDDHTNAGIFFWLFVGACASLVSGALFYAMVGWFVDTLNVLTQIAKNTATNA